MQQVVARMDERKLDEIQQKPDESSKAYRIRLYKNKDLYGLSNIEIGELCNKSFGVDWDESAHRKKTQNYLKGYNDAIQELKTDESYLKILDEINESKRALEREKIKFRDERMAWSQQNRLAARAEHKLDYLEQAIQEMGANRYAPLTSEDLSMAISETEEDKHMIVCLSDLHIGQTFYTQFGCYDSNIAKRRLNDYLTKILELQKLHNAKNCYVLVCGDLISGNIHKQIAVTNRENVIDQIKLASEYVSDFCYELCRAFQYVQMISASGNHSRIDTKDEALHDERLDDLVSFIVCKSLKSVGNFNMLTSDVVKFDTSLTGVYINSKLYLCVHGDYDSFSKSGAANLSLMIRQIPYAIISGHKHYPAMSIDSDIVMLQSGCLCGSGDDYTVEKRLSGKPSQTVCICDSDGYIEAVYPIIFR